jgi:multisubunit Na+/H+ antiporter MnhB subunit
MAAYLWTLLDLVLAALVIALGWAAVASADLKRAVVLFIAFGLLMAIIWARLNAPDLALAEAAIGAGLSGALLLAALRDQAESTVKIGFTRGPLAWFSGLLSLAVAGVVAWALLHAYAAAEPMRLTNDVRDQLANSGVSNPVTAVLLNFRAYDTLLELAVLLAAVLGLLAVGPARPAYQPAGSLFGGLVSWLVPLLIVTGGYLLWVGAHAPGGAFQAGALLAAAAVLLRLGGKASAGLPGPEQQRWLLVAGIGVFIAVGLAAIAAGQAFLQYPQAWAGSLILLIETAATLSIAATLALAYIGGRKPAVQGVTTEKNSIKKKRPESCPRLN